MGQASLALLRLIFWTATDFKMESVMTTRAYCLCPPCDPSMGPVLIKQFLHL